MEENEKTKINIMEKLNESTPLELAKAFFWSALGTFILIRMAVQVVNWVIGLFKPIYIVKRPRADRDRKRENDDNSDD